ncbi:unnamed protein product [Camellia sinensis]
MILIPVSLAAIGGTTSVCHPPTGVALLRRRHRPTDDHSSRRCSKSRSELYEELRDSSTRLLLGNLWKLSVIIG